MTYLKILTIIALVSSLSLIVPVDSFAESEYILSHFYSKGKLTNLMNLDGEESATIWTMINGDKGTVVSTYKGAYSVSRLDMNSYYSCGVENNIVCINGTITSVKNSKISNVGDTITIMYDVPNWQSFTFYDGPFAGTTLDLILSDFNVKNVGKIIEQNIKQDELDAFQQESLSKIREALELIYSPEILSALQNSNEEFAALEDPYALIDERNDEWILAEDDEVTPFMGTLLGNKASTFLQKVLNEDKMKPTDYVYEEIFLTNAYGANVAQTGKTTDYKQWDEQWWNIAKLNGVSMKSGFDESAGVQSLDMSFRIQNEYGKFLGVAKFVINTEKLGLEQ